MISPFAEEAAEVDSSVAAIRSGVSRAAVWAEVHAGDQVVAGTPEAASFL